MPHKQHSQSLTPPRILALVGPTASGKTPLSLFLAQMLDGEIVSADSRQIYKFLDIGTAKPTRSERRRIVHHFIDILDPKENYSAGQYGANARKVIGEIIKRGKLPIIVGGSGLYVKAVIDGLFDGPGKDAEIRERLEEQVRSEGIESLVTVLRQVDALALQNMKEVTPRRVIRALEVYYVTGKPISEFHAEQESRPDFDAVQLAFKWERKDLYARIDQRVDRMIADGLVDEVRGLAGKGYARHLNALNTVGYKEVFDFLEGLIDLTAMAHLIKRNSRRFAKRQMTWFNADRRIRWIPMTVGRDYPSLAHEVAGAFRAHVKER